MLSFLGSGRPEAIGKHLVLRQGMYKSELETHGGGGAASLPEPLCRGKGS